jgi:flagellar basal body-associated protein FliL
MTEIDVQKLTDALSRMPAPKSGEEWTVYAVLILFLVATVVALFRWLVKVSERAEERGTNLVRETTAALTANTASNEKLVGAIDRLAGEVRHDHSRTQRISGAA